LKRTLLALAKVGVSVAIVVYLVSQARQSLGELHGQPPHWWLLSASSLLFLLMVAVTIVRWYLLVRALELPFRLRDAFRLGFLGYLFNFVSLGSVGGDLFRAIFIAREQPGRRAEAVATVFVDRLIGLYALFVVAAMAVLLSDLGQRADERVKWLCQFTLLLTAVSTACVLLVLIPGFTNGWLSRRLTRLPRIGHTAGRLLHAVRLYRRKYPTLLLTGLLSLAVHGMSSVGIFLAARGLRGEAPGLAEHFLIVPLAMLAGALPVSLNGVGVFEGVIALLYSQMPGDDDALEASGSMVGLTYRAITIGIAIIGFCYYLANRAVVSQVLKRAAREPEAVDDEDALAGPLHEAPAC
jgi:uncharacterized membrane protein YbhN (UPF0104 family)